MKDFAFVKGVGEESLKNIYGLSKLNIDDFARENFKQTKLNFDKGLEKTIQWYLDNPEIMESISSDVLSSTPWKSSN